jgi:predicted transcriptional regulator
MSDGVTDLKGVSESVRISAQIKHRLKDHCRRTRQTLRSVLDAAVHEYVQEKIVIKDDNDG